MDFGAFVELEPGIEGLVHISELSHKRVWRPADVVKEGEQVEVLVLSVDRRGAADQPVDEGAGRPARAGQEGSERSRRRPSVEEAGQADRPAAGRLEPLDAATASG